MPKEDPLNNVTREEFKSHSNILFKKLDGVTRVLGQLLQIKQDQARLAEENRIEAQHAAQREILPQPKASGRISGPSGAGAAFLAGAATVGIPRLFEAISSAVINGLGLGGDHHDDENDHDEPESHPSPPAPSPQRSAPSPSSIPTPATSTPAAAQHSSQRVARPTTPRTNTTSSSTSQTRSSITNRSSTPQSTSTSSSSQEGGPQRRSSTRISGMDDIKNMIKRHEGVRRRPYRDSLGKWTVGVGHLISPIPGGPLPPEWNRELSDQEVDSLFEGDFARHVDIAKSTPGYNRANRGGKAAMIDLAFNMGRWWPGWHETSAALEAGDFATAAERMKNSRWYRQVGSRGAEIVELLRNAAEGGSQSLQASDIQPTTHVGEHLQTQSHAATVTPVHSSQGGVIDQSRTTVTNSTHNNVHQPVTNLSARNNNPTLANHDAQLTAASSVPAWHNH